MKKHILAALPPNTPITASVLQLVLCGCCEDTPKKGDKGDKGDDGNHGHIGPSGNNGSTPMIGGNGNWFIDGIDTGVPATGGSGQGYTAEQICAIDKLITDGICVTGVYRIQNISTPTATFDISSAIPIGGIFKEILEVSLNGIGQNMGIHEFGYTNSSTTVNIIDENNNPRLQGSTDNPCFGYILYTYKLNLTENC